MIDPKEAAVIVEAVKIAMSQSKDGTKITLVIHHDDAPATTELFSHLVGTRYKMAMVPLDDNEEPIPKHEAPAHKYGHKSHGERAVQRAGILAGSIEFQEWLVSGKHISSATEDEAAQFIRRYCAVASRTELAHNKEALSAFQQLEWEYTMSNTLGGAPDGPGE